MRKKKGGFIQSSILPSARVFQHKRSTNQNEFRIRIKGTLSITSGATNPIFAAFFINFPSWIRNSSGSIVQCDNLSSVLARMLTVFDQYMVTGLRVDYMPYINVATADTTGLSPVWFSNFDLDDTANSTTLNNVLNDTGIKQHSAFERWSRYERTPNPGWFNCISSVSTPSTTSTLTQLTQTPLNPHASIKVNIESIPATTAGQFVLTWYVRWRGINLNSGT